MKKKKSRTARAEEKGGWRRKEGDRREEEDREERIRGKGKRSRVERRRGGASQLYSHKPCPNHRSSTDRPRVPINNYG